MKFTPVPKIGYKHFTPRAMLLLGEIYSFYLQKKPFYSDLDALAKRLEISPRQARRVLDELLNKGVIKATEIYGKPYKQYHIDELNLNKQVGKKAAPNVINDTGTDLANYIDLISLQVINNLQVDNNLQVNRSKQVDHLPPVYHQPVSCSDQSVRSYMYSGRKERTRAMEKIEGEFAEMVERNLMKPDEFEHTNAYMLAGRRPMKRWPDLWLTPLEMHAVFEFLSDHLVQARWSSVFHMAQAEAVTQKLKGKDTSTINAFKYITTFAMQAAQEASLKAQLVKKHGRSI